MNAVSEVEITMARVYVSVGSNIGREPNIRSGIAALRRQFGPLVISTVYENEPVGFAGEDFFNLVAGFDTGMDVHRVARCLRQIEVDHGRSSHARKFSPRTLDLDLLLYDDLVLEEGRLRIPRDDILQCDFVLYPLAEVAGQRRHPQSGITFAELWQAFDKGCQRLRPVDLDL